MKMQLPINYQWNVLTKADYSLIPVYGFLPTQIKLKIMYIFFCNKFTYDIFKLKNHKCRHEEILILQKYNFKITWTNSLHSYQQYYLEYISLYLIKQDSNYLFIK